MHNYKHAARVCAWVMREDFVYCWWSFGISLVCDSTVQSFLRCPWFVHSFNIKIKTNNKSAKAQSNSGSEQYSIPSYSYKTNIGDIFENDPSRPQTYSWIIENSSILIRQIVNTQHIQSYLCVHFISYFFGSGLGTRYKFKTPLCLRVCVPAHNVCECKPNWLRVIVFLLFILWFGFWSIREDKIESQIWRRQINLLWITHYIENLSASQ